MPLPSLAHRPVATNFGEGLVPASYKALAAAENIFATGRRPVATPSYTEHNYTEKKGFAYIPVLPLKRKPQRPPGVKPRRSKHPNAAGQEN